jgi:hypothetical protein
MGRHARRLWKRLTPKRHTPCRRPFRLAVEPLELRDLPTGAPAYAVGAAPGGEPWVWVYDTDGQQVTTFLAYESTFTGGVRVAAADLDGDGTLDFVTAPGPGGGPRVRAFDGATGDVVADFLAYEETFTGGVFVAAGPVGDGHAGIATGADAGGGPRVRVFVDDGTSTQDFFAFDPSFTGGVRVALGLADTGPTVYAASGLGMAPTVRGFDVGLGSQVSEQAAGSPSQTGGVWVTAGDLGGDGADDLVTAVGSGSGTELRQYSGAGGALVSQATVGGAASGVGVLDWGGQPAVGLLSGTTLTAYALAGVGEAPTVLGQASESGWGAGSSIGGGSRADLSLYPRLVAITEQMWYPAMMEGADDQIRLRETVTQVNDDEYRWRFVFTNTSKDYGAPCSFYNLGVGWLELSVSDLDDITRFETPADWTANKDSLNPDVNGPVVRWETSSDFIMPTQSRTFTFYTPPQVVAWYGGIGHSPRGASAGSLGAEGMGLAPEDGPRIVITVIDPATGLQVPVTADGLKVAKWQNAFDDVLGKDGQTVVDAKLRGPDAGTNWDFIDRDPDRFNVWVRDTVAWNANTQHVLAGIETKNSGMGLWFTQYNDNETAVDLVRYNGTFLNTTGWYWSDSQMLVSNKVDDEYTDPGYLQEDDEGPGPNTVTKNGYTWKVSDRTHKIALGGAVRAEYTDGANHTVDARAEVKINKVVKVHVNILKDTAGAQGTPVVEKADAQRYVTGANEQYAQVGIRLKPRFSDPVDPPTEVDLSDGLSAYTWRPGGALTMTQEEKDLLGKADLRSPAGDSIEVYYVNKFDDAGQYGESFPASAVPAIYADSVILSSPDTKPAQWPQITVAHEIGHVLLDSGSHYEGPARKANLMVDGPQGIQDPTNLLGPQVDVVTGSKRLTVEQEAIMLCWGI